LKVNRWQQAESGISAPSGRRTGRVDASGRQAVSRVRTASRCSVGIRLNPDRA
jgi:hypothetical protein